MRIAHTADIHIRALSRHDEYRQVFKAFIDDCRTQNVDHIFIGGDIFHTKVTGISPEYIDLLTWWLTEMAKVAPVHMVLGNHDGNLVNLSRQDAVTPIVEAMNNPRVFLYKKSGVYNFSPGYNWCVFSCFDEDGWKDVKPIPGDINIATFHGSVRGSVTETGWEVEGDDITADFFQEYDFCMLGDIHRQQFLGYREGKPWIGYPGPPIQQNYAEQIEHGYFLWNIESNKKWHVENRSLPNPRPYVTIDWAGNLDKTIEKASKFPTGSRFRIKSDIQLSQSETHLVNELLKTRMSATEVTYKIDARIDTQAVKTDTTSIAKNDLRSPEVISKLLKSYYKDQDLSKEDWESLTETANEYLSKVATSEDLSRGSKWSLRQLQWDNMFSYGEQNIINFEKLNGIVGIFGSNRIGKSSIVGTLMYTLFNSTDRGPIKNINICNVRKDYCSSRAIFDHNGISHVIERQTTKSTNKKGVTTATTSLNLFRMRDDGEMDDLCGEQRNDTEKTVRTLLGTAEDFLMTSLSAQGESNQFISQGSAKRRAVLTKFLDLDVFDKMHDLSSKEVSSVKSQLKNFPERNWEEINSQKENQIIELKEKIQKLNDLTAENLATLNLLKQDLLNHSSSIVTQEDVDAQERKVKDLEKKSEECKEKIDNLLSEVSSMQEKIEALQSIVSAIDAKSLKEKLESQRKLQAAIAELRHSYERDNDVLIQQKKSLKILDEVPCGDDYPTCKFIKDAHLNKKMMPDQEKKLIQSFNALNSAKEELEKISDSTIEEKIAKHAKAIDLISKLNLEISKKETDIEKYRSSCDSCKDSLLVESKKLISLKESLGNNENIEAVLIRSKISESLSLSKIYDSQKLENAQQIGKIQSEIEKILSEKKTRDDLLKSVKNHELISNAFSKKGIPMMVTRSQLPLINSEVSKILHGIADFTIELEADEDTDSLEIYINYGDSRRIIELCSGMEKTFAAISLRVAMSNISSLPKPDFFIVDEGFGTLDSAGVEACNRLLVSLKGYFKTIVVITHVDGIKDSADHVIEITKKEKDTHVEFE